MLYLFYPTREQGGGALRRKWVLSLAVVILAVLVGWLIWANKALQLNTYTVSGRFPAELEGFRIAQVSDLHNARMGKDNLKLLTMLRETKPDLIAMTGDLVDSRRTDLEVAIAFAQEATKIAPCYYVPGNHENRIPEYPQLKEALAAAGVVVLEDEKTQIVHNGVSITLLGLKDPSFDTTNDADEAVVKQRLSEIFTADDGFAILLSHRPELLPAYAESGVDLVLSGHAHGGQVRLPFVGGVIAPHQGLFPEYDGGVYVQEGTQMVVSRGVGNSVFPLRVNNRPEVVLIELRK